MCGNSSNGIKRDMYFSKSDNLNVKEKLEFLKQTKVSNKFVASIRADLYMSKCYDILKK